MKTWLKRMMRSNHNVDDLNEDIRRLQTEAHEFKLKLAANLYNEQQSEKDHQTAITRPQDWPGNKLGPNDQQNWSDTSSILIVDVPDEYVIDFSTIHTTEDIINVLRLLNLTITLNEGHNLEDTFPDTYQHLRRKDAN
jgi:hypothetical protein